MEFKALLRKIYALHLSVGRERVAAVEQFLDVEVPDALSVDDHRNLPDFYRELAEQHLEALSGAIHAMLAEMRRRPYECCDELLDALQFLQHVVASALWRYYLPVTSELEAFAREYDRLDVPSERRRLYGAAQRDLR